MGAYCSVDDIIDCIEQAKKLGFETIQKTVSHSHSNEREGGPTREYFDVIFNTEDIIGFNIKLTAKANGYKLGDIQ